MAATRTTSEKLENLKQIRILASKSAKELLPMIQLLIELEENRIQSENRARERKEFFKKYSPKDE